MVTWPGRAGAAAGSRRVSAGQWIIVELTPADTLVAVRVPTWVGTCRLVVSAKPIWPTLLDPQHHTVPPVFTAQECEPPTPTAVNVLPLAIRVGTLRCVVVPSPTE